MMAEPFGEGWYWFHTHSLPANPELYYVSKPLNKETLCSRKGAASLPDSWEFVKKQDRVFAVEKIGALFPECLMPKDNGYYWMFCRDGTKHIIKVQIALPFTDRGPAYLSQSLRAEIVGSQYTHSFLSIVEAYGAVRVEYLAPADEDYHKSSIKP
jgi:hypothetical protein